MSIFQKMALVEELGFLDSLQGTERLLFYHHTKNFSSQHRGLIFHAYTLRLFESYIRTNQLCEHMNIKFPNQFKQSNISIDNDEVVSIDSINDFICVFDLVKESIQPQLNVEILTTLFDQCASAFDHQFPMISIESIKYGGYCPQFSDFICSIIMGILTFGEMVDSTVIPYRLTLYPMRPIGETSNLLYAFCTHDRINMLRDGFIQDDARLIRFLSVVFGEENAAVDAHIYGLQHIHCIENNDTISHAIVQVIPNCSKVLFTSDYDVAYLLYFQLMKGDPVFNLMRVHGDGKVPSNRYDGVEFIQARFAERQATGRQLEIPTPHVLRNVNVNLLESPYEMTEIQDPHDPTPAVSQKVQIQYEHDAALIKLISMDITTAFRSVDDPHFSMIDSDAFKIAYFIILLTPYIGHIVFLQAGARLLLSVSPSPYIRTASIIIFGRSDFGLVIPSFTSQARVNIPSLHYYRLSTIEDLFYLILMIRHINRHDDIFFID